MNRSNRGNKKKVLCQCEHQWKINSLHENRRRSNPTERAMTRLTASSAPYHDKRDALQGEKTRHGKVSEKRERLGSPRRPFQGKPLPARIARTPVEPWRPPPPLQPPSVLATPFPTESTRSRGRSHVFARLSPIGRAKSRVEEKDSQGKQNWGGTVAQTHAEIRSPISRGGTPKGVFAWRKKRQQRNTIDGSFPSTTQNIRPGK